MYVFLETASRHLRGEEKVKGHSIYLEMSPLMVPYYYLKQVFCCLLFQPVMEKTCKQGQKSIYVNGAFWTKIDLCEWSIFSITILVVQDILSVFMLVSCIKMDRTSWTPRRN